MYSVYQHWDPLKTCIVGKSYPPEFYSWIKNPKTRSVFERIAQETEEDFQLLIKILEKFNVEVLRLDATTNSEEVFRPLTNQYEMPPMTPRDIAGVYNNQLLLDVSYKFILYNYIKPSSWPTINTYEEFIQLPENILNEINNEHVAKYPESMYQNIEQLVGDNVNVKYVNASVNTATTTRIGKDLYTANDSFSTHFTNTFDNTYRINGVSDIIGHSDSHFCPVVPGLIISITDVKTYKDTFPGWEVVYLPNQSWDKVKPFLELKVKNQGKWWIPGEEYNNDVIETIDTWMSKWVGYVEETVFDVNMLVINEKNVIVNNYNKQVFDAFDRYGITPHICNFRHRYFWDGGLHCITLDLDREGEMKDYFPERA